MPRFPLRSHHCQTIRFLLGQIGTLSGILNDVEQIVGAIHTQILPITSTQSTLTSVVHAPVHGAIESGIWRLQNGRQRNAIEWIVRVCLSTTQLNHRGRPVHGHAMLIRDATRLRNALRPVRNPWHPNAAFSEVHFAAHQGPVVAETFSTVVAGEHNQGVVELSSGLERIHHPTNALVHVVDHAVVGVNVATLQMEDIVFDAVRYGTVISGLPRPMGRGVVHAQEKGLLGRGRHSLHKVDGLARNQIGQIAFVWLRFFTHPQIMVTG